MDVDIPQNEEAMETDPPITDERPELSRKESVVDPDGDEVMQGDEEEVFDEDIVLGEGEEEEEEEEQDYDVDVDGGDQGIGETQEESLETEEGDVGVSAGEGSSPTVQDASTLNPPASKEAKEPIAAATAHIGHALESAKKQSHTEKALEQASDSKTDNAVNRVDNAEEHGEGNHHEVDSAEQNDAEDEEHGDAEQEDEEEEGEDEYELLTPTTLPPIILNLPNSRIALFNPDSDLPVWFSERIEELCEAPLTQVWAAIRAKLDEEGQGNDDEMVVIEKLMDLKMGDVSLSPPSSLTHAFSPSLGCTVEWRPEK